MSHWVLITGASSGIGHALVCEYINAGWNVIACGRRQQALDDLHSSLRDSSRLHTLVFDMNQRDAVMQASLSLDATLDLVILNAGTCEYIDNPHQHFDSSLFERVIQTNLIGMANCIEYFMPKLKRPGRIALMGSSSSYLPLTRAQAYGASKAATSYLAQSLAIDLYAHQISVSLINPGFVETPLTQANDFPMPAIVSSTKAASIIRQQLDKGKAEIHFPKRFTLLLKFIGLLPQSWWLRLSQAMLNKQSSAEPPTSHKEQS
ncbi:SDR family NAD(P)-dependent oxidoreductase [Alginatibacterium sediminis]|uniref:SDR family NAD(P)-dependent oxidoreductase n=1 Tax=Alginatibacterium sediminis TaxID=2164068 RepID=A0A420E858_9ALTE|nr:SDR family NAD(P)-dependent oxidoreductase [Alginatibacterium sediminis]RKF15709.1 SDR family NAD(P)-dependent oxidoreductase [Alginatibacterium sediminis]